MRHIRNALVLLLLLVPGASAAPNPYVMVLGIAQDGGYPQAGCSRPDCVAAWKDPKLQRHVASLAIVDPLTDQHWIVDATPDFPRQLQTLGNPKLDGILLTHAHIGHYLGLAQLGREVIGAHGIRVYAMPRMKGFLEHNGPWDQLVRLGNIVIEPIDDHRELRLNKRISITPVSVPHRDEYSETVAYIIKGPSRSILWLPDIDRMPDESLIKSVDVAYIDGTFFDGTELPGRNRAEIPHPLVVDSMRQFAAYRDKVRFIHLNQSNPALRKPSMVKPFHVAKEGEREDL